MSSSVIVAPLAELASNESMVTGSRSGSLSLPNTAMITAVSSLVELPGSSTASGGRFTSTLALNSDVLFDPSMAMALTTSVSLIAALVKLHAPVTA